MPRLPVPLFHGTSSAFLESIFELGLGASDPVAEMGGVSCLRALSSIAELALKDDEWWQAEADVTRRMCEQSISEGGFNFRHGGSYLSASRLVAVRYALTSCIGSELLSACIELYRRLKPHELPELRCVAQAYASIFQLGEQHAEPVLIELKGVSADHLLNEQGESPVEMLESLNNTLSFGFLGEDGEQVLQGHNFVLTAPTPVAIGQVSIICLIEPDPSFPKYSLSAYANHVT